MTDTRNKPKYVYVIGAPESTTVKIGITVDLDDRLRQIQSMCPVKVAVLWATPGSGALERALHRRFTQQRSHGEWFVFDDDPVGQIREAIADGLDAVIEQAVQPEDEVQQEPAESSLPAKQRMILDGLRRCYPRTYFAIHEAASQLGYEINSMRDALESLLEVGKVTRGPQRHPAYWREQRYALVVGTRV